MSKQTWQELLTQSVVDGPVLTAAAAASCIPAANRIVLPPSNFEVGRALRLTLSGRLSCAITTPGTARWDIRMGAAGSTIVFDTGALNLNIVAKADVPYLLEVELVCRAIGTGTSTVFFPTAFVQSEAIIASPLPSVGGNGSLLVPVGTPAVGAGMDNSAASIIDVFFTQTVATGSQTLHNYRVVSLN